MSNSKNLYKNAHKEAVAIIKEAKKREKELRERELRELQNKDSDKEQDDDTIDEESYYDILGVGRNPTDAELKSRKRELTKQFHPDKLPLDKKEEGAERFKKINEAYAVLTDPEKKRIYDLHGIEGLHAKEAGFGGEGGDFDPTDLINKAFNKKYEDCIRVPPIQIRVSVSLEDLLTGKDGSHDIDRFTLCYVCGVTGFEDRTKHTCDTCRGKGYKMEPIEIVPGLTQPCQTPCLGCDGSGRDNKYTKCKKCSGNMVFREKVKMSYKIEPGMHTGDTIVLKYCGNELPLDLKIPCKRGDVIFIIDEMPHENFIRGVSYDGRVNPANILMEINLQLHESLCGFVKTFKYLDGTQVYIDNNTIIKDGDMKIINNQGLPYKGKTDVRGDLFVKFKIIYPTKITENNKIKLYEILTNKKYNAATIHKLPQNSVAANLKDIKEYLNTNYNPNEKNNKDNKKTINDPSNVQCQTQ